MTAALALYWRRRRAGQCVQCGKAATTVHCAGCAAQRRQTRWIREQRFVAGERFLDDAKHGFMSIPLSEQIACIRREHALRTRTYPNFVATRRMTQAWADYQIQAILDVLHTLEMLQGHLDASQLDLVPQEETHEAEHQA